MSSKHLDYMIHLWYRYSIHYLVVAISNQRDRKPSENLRCVFTQHDYSTNFKSRGESSSPLAASAVSSPSSSPVVYETKIMRIN